MYHGVTGAEGFTGVVNHYGYNVPAASFVAQVTYIEEHCNPVSLADIVTGRLSTDRTNVLLTFDDGYENNFTCAQPVLERFGVPALFALPTGFVCRGEPLWNDVIEAAVGASSRPSVRLSWDGEEDRFDLDRAGGRTELLLWLMRRAVGSEPQRRDDLIGMALGELEVEVASEVMFENADYRPLQGDQIRRMVDSGLAEFASHSVSHFMMAGLQRDAKRRELEESKLEVEALTGCPCRAFCVPGGSYDDELVEEAHSVGYEVLLTSDWGWADPTAQTLNRCGIFASYDRFRFADEIHGPVVRSLVALRRAVRSG